MNEIFSGGLQSLGTGARRSYVSSDWPIQSAAHTALPTIIPAPVLCRSFDARVASTVDATQAILDEIKDLKSQPFTEEELKRAKDQVLNSFIFSYDSVEKIAQRAGQTRSSTAIRSIISNKYRSAAVEKVTTGDPRSSGEEVYRPLDARDSRCRQTRRSLARLSRSWATVQKIDITIPMPPGMAGPAWSKAARTNGPEQ